MKIIKGLLVTIALAFLGFFAFTQGMALHDQRTRQELLADVRRELPVGASLDAMRVFLQRYAAAFDLDDRFNHVYSGLLPQSRLDKDLFDRKVGIDLYFDRDHRFTRAEVNISYTFL